MLQPFLKIYSLSKLFVNEILDDLDHMHYKDEEMTILMRHV